MRAVKQMRFMILFVLIAGLTAVPLFAAEVNFESRINKEIKIELNDVTIVEALKKISDTIDVPIRISDEAEWKLPYGKSTRLSVTLKGPASEAMTQMLNEFFMRYALGENEIVIYPRPELDHIIGRPSTRQLNVLKAIYTNPIRLYITDNVSATMNTALEQEVFISPISLHETINIFLRKLAGQKKFKIGEFIDSKEPVLRDMLPPDKEGNEEKEYTLPTAVTLPQLLIDIRLGRNPAEWYIPSIDLPNQVPEIRIVEYGTLRRLRQRQLIDVSFEDETLLEIFQTLADRGKVYYRKNSNAVHDLEERITVSMQNVTAMQAMKKIADMAQLIYDADGYEFYIEGKVKPPQPKVRPASVKPRASSGSDDRGQYVGKISIPMDGGKYFIEYMLRESDLTEELKKLRTEKIAEILGKDPNAQATEKPAVPEE